MLRDLIQLQKEDNMYYLGGAEWWTASANNRCMPCLSNVLYDIYYKNESIFIHLHLYVATTIVFDNYPDWVYRGGGPNSSGIYWWHIIWVKALFDPNLYEIIVDDRYVSTITCQKTGKKARIISFLRQQRRTDGVLGTSTLYLDIDRGDIMQATGYINKYDSSSTYPDTSCLYTTETCYKIRLKKKFKQILSIFKHLQKTKEGGVNMLRKTHNNNPKSYTSFYADARDYITLGWSKTGGVWWSNESINTALTLYNKQNNGSTNTIFLTCHQIDDNTYQITGIFNLVLSSLISFYTDNGLIIDVNILKLLQDKLDNNIISIVGMTYSSVWGCGVETISFNSNDGYTFGTDHVDFIMLSRLDNNKLRLGNGERLFYSSTTNAQAILINANFGIVKVEKKANLTYYNTFLKSNNKEVLLYMLRGIKKNISQLESSINTINTQISTNNTKISNIEYYLYNNMILYNDFASNFTTTKSIKIPKTISYILIECGYSHHFYTTSYYGVLMASYVGSIPTKTINLMHLWFSSTAYPNITGTSYSTAITSFNFGTETQMIYDGMDNDYYYYHMSSPGGLYDNLLRITGLKKNFNQSKTHIITSPKINQKGGYKYVKIA